MPSPMSVYTDLTKSLSEEVTDQIRPFSPATDAARKQLMFNWLQSQVTREMISSIKKEMEDYTNRAIALAVAYPTNNNHQEIIQLLVRVDQLRKVVNTYGRSN